MSDASPVSARSAPSLPLAVHIGFSGARDLVPDGLELDAADRSEFEAQVYRQLKTACERLPSELGLTPQHFVVTVSQMAAGADLLFSRVARELRWPQRVLLPQSRDAYVDAVGSGGRPDFTDAQRAEAIAHLESERVIEELVVSSAPRRGDRFQETNFHVVSASDLLVCLTVAGRAGRRGGAQALIEPALAREIPVLELELTAPGGQPQLRPVWRHPTDPTGRPIAFAPPQLPPAMQAEQPALVLSNGEWPEPRTYVSALKSLASQRAGQRRIGFRRAAIIIVGTHVFATLLAALVVTHSGPPQHDWMPLAVKAALGVEIVLLIGGFVVHFLLHHHRHTEEWAIARLCAEICRSVLAYGQLPGRLTFLMHLPVPGALDAVLRTMNVVHLKAVRQTPHGAWRDALRAYIAERFEGQPNGQIPYYRREQAKADRIAGLASGAFALMSFAAILATGIKLAMKFAGVDATSGWFTLTSVLGIWLPVAAVGAMSLAAALDVEARKHVFSDQLAFLEGQLNGLRLASAPIEAEKLAQETESRLLAETATWYARRAFTSVA
jgi:hypothetical protein